MDKSVKCKECGEKIFAEYTPLEGPTIKYFSELLEIPTNNCNTPIYLSCGNNHTRRYYCNIENIKENIKL